MRGARRMTPNVQRATQKVDIARTAAEHKSMLHKRRSENRHWTEEQHGGEELNEDARPELEGRK